MSDEVETKIQYLGQPRPRDVTYDAMQKRIAQLETALEKAADTLHDAGCHEAWAEARAVLGGERQ